MRKSTLFLSAVLTTFVLAMLAGVASAYQGVINNSFQANTQTQQQDQSKVETVSQAAPVQTEAVPVNVTPEQAAGLAAQVLGRDDLYSVEVSDLNGESVYLVTFSSGDLVYVSLDGQIRSIGHVEVQTVTVGGGNRKANRDSGSATANNTSSQNHESEHESYDEHDD